MGWNDRDELVELMGRYADVSDTNDWHELSLAVFCDQITCDFSSLGAPVTIVSREVWCQQGERAFAGWAATHHAITGHRISVDGDRATIRAHARAGRRRTQLLAGRRVLRQHRGAHRRRLATGLGHAHRRPPGERAAPPPAGV